MTLRGVIAIILLFFYRIRLLLLANYVTVVVGRHVLMSVKYCLSVQVFRFWPYQPNAQLCLSAIAELLAVNCSNFVDRQSEDACFIRGCRSGL